MRWVPMEVIDWVFHSRAKDPVAIKRGRHVERTTYFPPRKRNGERERNRRLRQIDQGRLCAENGLAKENRP